MRENNKLQETTSASTGDELLKVLIDKVVENGSKIGQIKEQIQKLQEPSAESKAADQRIAVLEQRSEVLKMGIDKVQKQFGQLEDARTKMTDLQNDLKGYIHIFENPKLKEVHHKHFLARPAMTFFVVFVIITAETAALITSRDKAEHYEQNDIKWRAACLSEDTTVTNTLNTCQRDYNADPVQFRKDIVTEEERRSEVLQSLLQKQEAEQKIQELQDAKKKKY
jgi:hypothetical protein